jgi:hypothetical protein
MNTTGIGLDRIPWRTKQGAKPHALPTRHHIPQGLIHTGDHLQQGAGIGSLQAKHCKGAVRPSKISAGELNDAP